MQERHSGSRVPNANPQQSEERDWISRKGRLEHIKAALAGARLKDVGGWICLKGFDKASTSLARRYLVSCEHSFHLLL